MSPALRRLAATPLLATPLLLIMAGCADTSAPPAAPTGAAPVVWQKAGATAIDEPTAIARCTTTADAAYPPQMRSSSGQGYTSASSANCSMGGAAVGATCGGSGSYVPGQTTTTDLNADKRATRMAICMRQAGWTAP